MKYANARNMPSTLVIVRFLLPKRMTNIRNKEATINIPISIFKLLSKFIGCISALVPRTKKILKMLEPRALPMAMSVFFFKAATIDVTSSGNEVAIAIKVSPIVDSEIPNSIEITEAPDTIHFPPKNKPKLPKIINIIDLE